MIFAMLRPASSQVDRASSRESEVQIKAAQGGKKLLDVFHWLGESTALKTEAPVG
jgi:hypothetical protein